MSKNTTGTQKKSSLVTSGAGGVGVNTALSAAAITADYTKIAKALAVGSVVGKTKSCMTMPASSASTGATSASAALSADLSRRMDVLSLSKSKTSSSHPKNKHELATYYGFNEDQIGVFEEAFQIFDKDSDGFITLVEIRTVMNGLGFYPCDENIRKSIQDIDNDNSGTVDFEEFICMMSKFRNIKSSIELDDELLQIFKIFDKNQDGFIDKVELKDVLVRLGEHISDEEVADMIKEADLDGDNRVSFEEFRSILYDTKVK